MAEYEFVVSEGPLKGAVRGFPGPRFLVGSSPDCPVHFDAEGLRPRHAEVMLDRQGVPWVRDLTGAGLVAINGRPTKQGPLALGSFVRLGTLELVVRERGGGGMGTVPTPAPRAGRSGSTPKAPRFLDEGALEPTARRATPAAAADAEAVSPDDDGTVRSAVLAPDTIIDGRYRAVGKLAAGGMGEVYRAEHVELKKPVALKVMRREFSRNGDLVERFKREAIAASRIGHQNIVDVSDFGRMADGRTYFVMEFLDGQTLGQLLEAQGALPVARAVALGLQVARALAAAHAQGIVHRDLKPDNVMVLQRPGQADFVKVLDFGLAKVAEGVGQGGQTAAGAVFGTPQYMSPEQARGIPVDARSDLYALGLILYELLAGHPCFTAETPSSVMVKHIVDPPPPLSPGPRGALPPALEQLVFHLLEKAPTDRPQSAEEVVRALEALQAGPRAEATPGLSATPARPTRPLAATGAAEAPPAPRQAPPRSGRSPWPWLLGGAVLLVLLGKPCGEFLHGRSPRAQGDAPERLAPPPPPPSRAPPRGPRQPPPPPPPRDAPLPAFEDR